MTMSQTQQLEHVAKQVGFRSLKRYRNRAGSLFRGISLEGIRMLDIGCGPGALALWAALHNAEYALGIEPESEGSSSGTLQKFQATIDTLNLNDRVEAKNLLLQDLPRPEKPFDVIVMFNVINHIDEDAVQVLHFDPKAQFTYKQILTPLHDLLAPDGWLIIADCGRKNFWNALGKKSPFAPTIEWNKHQQPKTWIELFNQIGFRLHDVRWSDIYPLGTLSSNRFVQYLTTSHFVLKFCPK